MKRMKSGLVVAALSLALLGVTGCANLQPAAPAPAPAPASAPAPALEEVHAEMTLGGMILSIYHPDTRIMYVWWGDPRPAARRTMNCIELHLSDDVSATPKSMPCPGGAPSGGPVGAPARGH